MVESSVGERKCRHGSGGHQMRERGRERVKEREKERESAHMQEMER